jgi:hypothetical protein
MIRLSSMFLIGLLSLGCSRSTPQVSNATDDKKTTTTSKVAARSTVGNKPKATTTTAKPPEVAKTDPDSKKGTKPEVAKGEPGSVEDFQKAAFALKFRWLQGYDRVDPEVDARIYSVPPQDDPTALDRLPNPTFPFGLEFGIGSINDAGMKSLARFKELRFIAINLNRDITDAGLEHLRDLTELEELHFSGSNFDDMGLTHLKNLKKLKVLNLNGNTNITDAGIGEIAGLTELRRLALLRSRVTDKIFEHIDDMKKLNHLETLLNNENVIVQHDRLGILHAMPFVWKQDPNSMPFQSNKDRPKNPKEVTHANFHLRGQMVTDATLKMLLKFENLTFLNAGSVNITAEGLKTVAQMKNLKEVVIYFSNGIATREQYLELKKALPKCKINVGQNY